MAIQNPLGNCKPKIYERYTHTQKRKRNPNIKVKIIIKSQENERRRKGEKRPTKTNPKQLTKWQ